MADISMCLGKGCPLRDTCYRHTAKPNEYRQAYFVSAPVKFDDEGKNAHCANFIDNGKSRITTPKAAP